MATNKVVYGNTTLIDLTNDTATEEDVVSGKTFHKASGVAATGTAELKKSPKITQIVYQEYTSQSTARTYTFTASEDMYIVGYGYANCNPNNSSTRSIVDIASTSPDIFIELNNSNKGKPSSSDGNSDAMVHVRGFIASGQTITFNITAYGTDAKGIIELFRFENVSEIKCLQYLLPNESTSTQTFTFTAPCDMYIVGTATANSKKTISSARHSIGITPSVNTITVTQHLTEKTSPTESADWGVIKTYVGFLPKDATISYSYLCYYYGCGCIAIYGFDGVYDPPENTEYNDMGVDNNYRYVDTSGMYVPASITPSNSSPASMSPDNAYKPSANGYAISSYTSVTPYSIGQYFPSGMVKMSSSGYAYSTFAECVVHTDVNTGTNSYTITGLQAGAHYLLLVFADSSKTLPNTRYDNVSISHCYSVTKLMNFYNDSVSHNSTGTIWNIVPNQPSITVSYTSNKFVLKLFSVEG